MQPFPIPQKEGDITKICEFLCVEDEETKLLLITWLISCFFSEIATPILNVTGPQGSGKSTFCRFLKCLVDPSKVPLMGNIKLHDLDQVFRNHSVVCLENVHRFSRAFTDSLCRAVTGVGNEKRKLYTDADPIIVSYRRAIIINGIDIPSVRPDFLDRSIRIECNRIEEFKSQKKLSEQFELERPKLFGSILDLVVKVLPLLESPVTSSEFRLVDYAQLGGAVAIALGKQPSDFETAYRNRVQEQSLDIIEDCPIARLLQIFSNQYPPAIPWRGTSSKLLTALVELDKTHNASKGNKNLPSSPRWLSTRLGELIPVLESEGISVKKMPRTRDAREWEITKSCPYGFVTNALEPRN